MVAHGVRVSVGPKELSVLCYAVLLCYVELRTLLSEIEQAAIKQA